MIKIEFRGSEVGETLWHSYELPTERKPVGPSRVVQWNYLTHPSIARGGKKNEGGIVGSEGNEVGGLTGTTTVAVTTFVDR